MLLLIYIIIKAGMNATQMTARAKVRRLASLKFCGMLKLIIPHSRGYDKK